MSLSIWGCDLMSFILIKMVAACQMSGNVQMEFIAVSYTFTFLVHCWLNGQISFSSLVLHLLQWIRERPA